MSQNHLDSLYFTYEQRIYESSNDYSLKQYYLLKKINLIISNQDYFKLNDELKRVNISLLYNHQLISTYYYNLSLISLLMQDFPNAFYAFNNFKKYQNPNTISTKLLELLCLYRFDPTSFENTLLYLKNQDSITFYPIYIEYSNLKYKPTKSSFKYQLCSAIIPGSGSIFLKEYKKGFASLLISSIYTISEYWIISNHLYFNAVFWGTLFFFKFYIGNIRLTKKIYENIYKKEYRHFVLSINNALNKYPIQFQHFDIQ